MNKSAELLVGIVVILLIIAGALYYVFNVPHVQAPTNTATSTAQQETQTSTSTGPTTGNIMLRQYTDPSGTYSFSYPNAGTLSGSMAGYSQDWMQNAAANGQLLVKVVFSASLQPKTNFVNARFTVGTSPLPAAVAQCLAAPVNAGPSQKSVVTINGVQYTRYTESDAAAGNRYDTVSYRTIRDGQCYALEYTIHYGNIQNYPSDSGISEFNEAQMQTILEEIVQSFKFS